MTPTWSLADRTTWIAILTVIAAALSDVFHRSFAGYVPAAATIAAGLVIAGVALAKHHYAAALASVASTLPPVQAPAPGLPASVTTALATAGQALTDVATLVSAPRAPGAPATAATAATTAPVPPSAAAAAPGGAQAPEVTNG